MGSPSAWPESFQWHSGSWAGAGYQRDAHASLKPQRAPGCTLVADASWKPASTAGIESIQPWYRGSFGKDKIFQQLAKVPEARPIDSFRPVPGEAGWQRAGMLNQGLGTNCRQPPPDAEAQFDPTRCGTGLCLHSVSPTSTSPTVAFKQGHGLGFDLRRLGSKRNDAQFWPTSPFSAGLIPRSGTTRLLPTSGTDALPPPAGLARRRTGFTLCGAGFPGCSSACRSSNVPAGPSKAKPRHTDHSAYVPGGLRASHGIRSDWSRSVFLPRRWCMTGCPSQALTESSAPRGRPGRLCRAAVKHAKDSLDIPRHVSRSPPAVGHTGRCWEPSCRM